MVALKSQFTPTQLDAITTRATIVERQAFASGTLIPGDEENEFYIDDPAALFVTNGVQAGDTIEITSGTSPLGSYTVSGLYYPPEVDGVEQEPVETRIIGIGYPTAATVDYRVVVTDEIWDELNSLTEIESRLINVDNVALKVINDIYKVYHEKFNNVSNYITSERTYLSGYTRAAYTYATLDTIANPSTSGNPPPSYSDSVLFPLGFPGVAPNRYPYGAYTVGIDAWSTSVVYADNELAGANEEAAEGADILSNPPPYNLTPVYNAALDKQDDALVVQGSVLSSLYSEIISNNEPSESGLYSPLFSAIEAEVLQAISDVAARRNDIDLIRAADLVRPNVGSLHNDTYSELTTEISDRDTQLGTAKYTAFNGSRYTWLNLIINRAYGTLMQIKGNEFAVSLNAGRASMLAAERAGHRALLGLLP